LVTPDLQGRILTSSANGEDGYSFGWLNYNLIASGKFLPHCNNFGGEDRFFCLNIIWLKPIYIFYLSARPIYGTAIDTKNTTLFCSQYLVYFDYQINKFNLIYSFIKFL